MSDPLRPVEGQTPLTIQERLDLIAPRLRDNTVYTRPAYTFPPPRRGKIIHFFDVRSWNPHSVVELIILHPSPTPSNQAITALEQYCTIIISTFNGRGFFHVEIEDIEEAREIVTRTTGIRAANLLRDIYTPRHHYRSGMRPITSVFVTLSDGSTHLIPAFPDGRPNPDAVDELEEVVAFERMLTDQ